MNDSISQSRGFKSWLSIPASGDKLSRSTGRLGRIGRLQNVSRTGRLVYGRGSTIVGSRSQDVFVLLTQAGACARDVHLGHGCVGERRSIERSLRAGTEPDIRRAPADGRTPSCPEAERWVARYRWLRA